MGLRISGKSIDIGDAFRGHAEARIGDALGKYFDGGFNGHVTVSRDGSGYRTDCAVHLDTGIVLQAEGTAQEVYQSFDMAAERIEKRLRRYKGRLKDHHKGRGDSEAATEYVIAATDESEDAPAEGEPVVIAEESTNLLTMTVSGAVMAMDLTDAPFVFFRNAGHGGVNVVYRRRDGNIGWLDPSRAGKSSAG